jgi:hypothetical protein
MSMSASAQEYLGQMRAADCVQRGGTPDSSITSDEDPDPIRNCWRYHTSSGATVTDGAASSTSTTTGAVSASGSNTNSAATALQVGGTALMFFGQFLSTLDEGGNTEPPPNPYAAQQAQFEAVKKAEQAALRREAHELNEEGRRYAEQGKTAVAMVSFSRAVDNAEKVGDYQNVDIYRDNMNLMKSYIAYDTGVRAWNNGRQEAARKSFNEALYLARQAHRDELAGKMAQQIKNLPVTGDGASDEAKEAAEQQCVSINGQLHCQ